MSHIRGAGRSEVLLFPEALDDYISDNNPVRFIEAFVMSLDLVELGVTRATPCEGLTVVKFYSHQPLVRALRVDLFFTAWEGDLRGRISFKLPFELPQPPDSYPEGFGHVAVLSRSCP